MGGKRRPLSPRPKAEVGCFTALFGTDSNRKAMADLLEVAEQNAKKKNDDHDKGGEASAAVDSPAKPAVADAEAMSLRKKKLFTDLFD